jgi:NDP-4-keto-2,6-dideoxyhexose 3-C-methyltransferase
MNVTEIKKCRICGNDKFITIMDLGVQELSGKFPKISDIDPPRSPLILVKCDDIKNPDACGLVQLKHSSEPDVHWGIWLLIRHEPNNDCTFERCG